MGTLLFVLFLLLLIAICWGVPTFLLMVSFSYAANNTGNFSDTDKKYMRFTLWSAVIGYPLGIMILIILIVVLKNSLASL